MTDTLPPLPATAYVLAVESDGYSPDRLLSSDGYGDEHMRAYAIAVRDAAVAAERERWQADAERYRWLRDKGDATWKPMATRVTEGASGIDAAIDAAMAVARATADPTHVG